jgi:hypothetical protein
MSKKVCHGRSVHLSLPVRRERFRENSEAWEGPGARLALQSRKVEVISGHIAIEEYVK